MFHHRQCFCFISKVELTFIREGERGLSDKKYTIEAIKILLMVFVLMRCCHNICNLLHFEKYYTYIFGLLKLTYFVISLSQLL